MACQKHREDLEESAADSLEPARQLRLDAHLHSCAACRKELTGRKLLYAAIDGGLRQRVNESLPPGFQARVRERVNAEAPEVLSRWWLGLWTPAWSIAFAAVLVLAAGLVLIQGVRRGDKPNRPELAKIAQPPVVESKSAPKNESPLPLLAKPAKRPARHINVERSVVHLSSAAKASAPPEVLVLAGQERAIAQLIDGLRKGEVPGEMLVARNRAIEFQPVVIPPLEELKPLEDEREPR